MKNSHIRIHISHSGKFSSTNFYGENSRISFIFKEPLKRSLAQFFVVPSEPIIQINETMELSNVTLNVSLGNLVPNKFPAVITLIEAKNISLGTFQNISDVSPNCGSFDSTLGSLYFSLKDCNSAAGKNDVSFVGPIVGGIIAAAVLLVIIVILANPKLRNKVLPYKDRKRLSVVNRDD